MRSLYLISLSLLTGTVFAVRCLLLPSLGVLTPEQATLLRGKLVPRMRRVLRITVIVLTGTGIYLFTQTSASVLSTVQLALTFMVAVVLWIVSVSPHRRIALEIERYRPQILNLALTILLALIIVYPFVWKSQG